MTSNPTLPGLVNGGMVLLLPPTRRDAEAIQKVLTGANILNRVYPDMNQLCMDLGIQAGAVLVSEEALTADPDCYIAWIASQPVWSDLATIMLSQWGAEQPKLTLLLPKLGNVSVVERPVRVTTLLSIVRSSLKARERQYQVKAHLTQLHEAQSDLRASQERLQLALETGKLGVWEMDLITQELTCSAACKANYGRAPGDTFAYKDLWNAMHKDDVVRVQAAINEAAQRRRDYETEYRVLWPDKTLHWILARGRLAHNGQAAWARLVGVTLDITERKTVEERRAVRLEIERTARTNAENAGRLKDEFLATLSHELRTPLSAILGWSNILGKLTHESSQVAQGLQIIQRNARAQAQIIEDLLDMSRIISGKVRLEVRDMDLAPVVQAAVDTVRPAADAKGVKLHMVLNSDSGPIRGDPDRLQQVLWNLLSNAVKFTPKNQRVQVVLEKVNSQVQVSVIDTGEGIKPEFLPHVFDRFRQADASTTRLHGGLGLGLAIVKQLVELHGGSVRASSPGIGKGAAFVVSLPVVAMRQPMQIPGPDLRTSQDAPPSAPFHRDDVSGVKVLVVDDEPDSRELVKRVFEDSGAQVTVAGSAGEALKLVPIFRPDVLITDIGMPGEDGYSLIRQVRSLSADQGGMTPAVALTAYAGAQDRLSTIRAGFQQHVAKPVEPTELVAIVASLKRRQG